MPGQTPGRMDAVVAMFCLQMPDKLSGTPAHKRMLSVASLYIAALDDSLLLCFESANSFIHFIHFFIATNVKRIAVTYD